MERNSGDRGTGSKPIQKRGRAPAIACCLRMAGHLLGAGPLSGSGLANGRCSAGFGKWKLRPALRNPFAHSDLRQMVATCHLAIRGWAATPLTPEQTNHPYPASGRSMFALHCVHDGNTYLLLKSACQPLGILFV